MFYTKDHKTGYLFDPFSFMGEQRRKLLDQSWAHLFREEILPELPVEALTRHYNQKMGRPTKELYSLLGLLILQQMFDLTDEEAVRQFAFNIEWHYALNITSESDNDKYLCPKTLWTMRKIVTDQDLYTVLFEGITEKLAKVLSIDPTHQRIDSMHIFSNMRHLGRIGLFVKTIKKFLANLKRRHKSLFCSLDKVLIDRYCTKSGESSFSFVKPSESSRTLQQLGEDLFFLTERFRSHGKVSGMSSYQLLARLLKEQCVIEENPDTGSKKVKIRPNKEISSDSLQNPSDPDAGYDGHKGKGYQVQVMETYQPSEEGERLPKQPSLITHVAVEPANLSDAHALLPAIASAKKRDLAPKELLADTLYGSDENCEKAKEEDVTLIAPVQGPSENKDAYTLSDFTLSERNKVTACPEGHIPAKTRHKKTNYSALFHTATCTACSHCSNCPVKPGKRGFYLRYNEKAARLAKRRASQNTDAFHEKYRYRAGSEATMSEYDRKTNVKHLRVRGISAVSFCAFLKAAGLNIFRAAAFRKGLLAPKGAIAAVMALTQRGLLLFKERFVFSCRFFRKRTGDPETFNSFAIQWDV